MTGLIGFARIASLFVACFAADYFGGRGKRQTRPKTSAET